MNKSELKQIKNHNKICDKEAGILAYGGSPERVYKLITNQNLLIEELEKVMEKYTIEIKPESSGAGCWFVVLAIIVLVCCYPIFVR